MNLKRAVFLILLSLTAMTWTGCDKSAQPYDPPPEYKPGGDTPEVPGTPDESRDTVRKEWTCGPLLGLWNHSVNLDVSALVQQLGVNCIWTGDNMITNSAFPWEQSHLYKSASVPGIDYVIAKINRVAWGWTHAGSLSHASWVCGKAKEHKEIVGLYLNDFYDEIEEGYRTAAQWREIIARIRIENPDIPIWVPVYPHRQQQDHEYDFDFDGVIVNMFGNKPEQLATLEEHIYESLAKFPDKWAVAGVYLCSGATGSERWLTTTQYEKILTFYVKLLNEGKIQGIRLFSADQFLQKPEFIEVTRKVFDTVKKK